MECVTGKQSRGLEALDPWGPGKCRISLGCVLDSSIVPQQDSLTYGLRPLEDPIMSFQYFYVHFWILRVSVSLPKP